MEGGSDGEGEGAGEGAAAGVGMRVRVGVGEWAGRARGELRASFPGRGDLETFRTPDHPVKSRVLFIGAGEVTPVLPT